MINIENLSKEDIYNAVNYIETNNIRLIESIRYDVIINNKRYPPKELIKQALNLLNDKKVNFIFEYIWYNSN